MAEDLREDAGEFYPGGTVVPGVPGGGGGGEGSTSQMMIEITHADIVTLRDNGGLIPGMQYRITDYVATTTQSHTQSANHPFDIIVTADSPNKLNEVARAIRHDGDTYFPETTKFEAWQIWYCLDNDTNRFGWADSANGKGVIYRMIDEWNNDVPYDFKGILTKAYIDVSWGLDFQYTFGGSEDQTIKANSYCYSNKIEARLLNGSQRLNQNTFGARCHSNTFGADCHSNTFRSDCSDNTFGSDCSHNTFGSDCDNNTFDSFCVDNTFGSDCDNNTFGSGCSGNNFGSNCYNNTFGSYCDYNTVQGFFKAIILQNSIHSNSIDCTADLGEYSYCQNIEIKSGVESGEINIDDVEQSYHTEIRPEGSITITV